ncbi:Arylsulfatase [Symmachiella macrocystis]|uniref:Arylsulfatase n=2 Tax=Symmachiella macrocystis TaxID=2527985 RepID=A0A5C6ASL5_9PLAN|nr:arylsulfatase [Symmachiella macrocystis]TWU03033.1 Arylsulfatase [Symmachiella macrocystis]
MNMKTNMVVVCFVATGVLASGSALAQQRGDDYEIDRSVLPIQEPKRPTYSELDARNVKAPPRFEVKAPKGAPNVVIVLIDDIGFGGPSTFGGPIQTPTLDRLARSGLRYNNFHTTALCSPTRVALKCGRNHHTANAGSIMETATAFPGNTGQIPNSVAPLAEMLRLNGYSTGAFGKWHETAAWETSVSGPYDRWPTHQGFDKFFGFIGGETDQWYPLVYDGVTRVAPTKMENYHFTTDMTNQAIGWIKAQQSMTPDKPFFAYYATGAVHAPHHVPQKWIDKYKGKFDKGWDKIRAESIARQKKMGIIPAETKLGKKPDDIKDWDALSSDEHKLFARQAEVFAGFLEQTDHEIGRLVKAVEEIGEMDNTLFIYIAGDNGTSAEGGFVGMYNEMTYFNNVTEKVEDLLPLIDKWGGPETFPHMAAGWAVAFDSPFSWTKQVASDFGGTRNGMVVHWPNGIKEKGGIRSQFGHVIDIAPTILEAASLPEPNSVNGTPQTPIEGVSLLYSLNDAKAKERHTTQYFEMFGNRAIYHDGWLARTLHRAPWQALKQKPLKSDVWDLYDVREDFSLVNNLAKKNPKKLKELQALFMKEAEKYHVLPIDDRVIERVNPALAGRPDVMAGRTSLTLYDGMNGMLENTFINVKNQSKTITAKLEIPKDGASGVILAQGGRFGGWSLYMKDGKPAYTYNFLGLSQDTIAAKDKIPAGPAEVKLDFKYDGGGAGKGGKATISVNGEVVAEGRIKKTQPLMFSADETADVGLDNQTPVVEGIGIGREETRFTGKIDKITVEVAEVK